MNKVALHSAVFNGIDAGTGRYYGAELPLGQLAGAIVSESPNSSDINLWRIKREETRAHYGLRYGIDANRLEEAGWGLIFAENCSPQIIDALKALRDRRHAQAGERYREYSASNGYKQGETAIDFLFRCGAGPGSVDPRIVPYYLLLVGDPSEIPFSFQYRLDLQYAVGRLYFDDVSGYASYSESLVAQEAREAQELNKAVFFAVKNPDDEPTRLSCTQLVEPLASRLSVFSKKWKVDCISAGATKARLCNEVHSDTAPGLLFSASHGLTFYADDPLQRNNMGALLCEDWPGPWQHQGAIPNSYYFAADDVSERTNLTGTIMFMFACYAAGTPTYDYFPETSIFGRRAIAPQDFVAQLPQKLLSLKRGSAKALVGHVERVWSYSFLWPGLESQTALYEDILKQLMSGCRLGFALEAMGQRYAELSTDIAEMADILRQDSTIRPDAEHLASMWTARNDARSFIILGDPAVQCC